MRMDAPSGALESIPDVECAKLLRAHDLGRIALVDADGRPLILPVNYFFDEGIIAFRTGPGSKLSLAPGSHVSFEIDGWDAKAQVGWSVVARGIAHDITEPRGMPIARIRYWPVEPKAPGKREHWIAIWVNEISGRKFTAESPRP